MPFKSSKGQYFIERRLPGYGDLRRTSLGTSRKADAVAIEAAVLEVHRRGLHDPRLFAILDAVQGQGRGLRGAVSPADILVAVKAPDGTEAGLQRLLQSIDDPPLADVVAERLAGAVTREERRALPVVLAAALAVVGRDCPASALRDAPTVERVLRHVEADAEKLPASVVRYEKTAISNLLTARYGRHVRDQVMGSVRYSGGDDRRRLRDSVVTADAIGRLVAALRAGYYKAGDEAAPLYVQLAVTTGATVSPLSRARVGHWNAGAGVLHLTGTKRAKKSLGTIAGPTSRDRDLQVPPQLVPRVDAFAAMAGEDPGANLFPLAYSRFGTMWKRAVKRAGLEEACLDARGQRVPMRPHDLRRVFALFARRAGLSAEKVGQAGLGHDKLETTNRYIRSATAIDADEAAAVASMLGI